MSESKLEIFLTKMEVAASNGSSGPENTTSSGTDPMMQRWLYGAKELLAQQDKRIIRLCKYPDMVPDELLKSYAVILVDVLERAERLHLFAVSSNDATQQVTIITKRLDAQDSYILAAKILDTIAYESEPEKTRYYGIDPELNDERRK